MKEDELSDLLNKQVGSIQTPPHLLSGVRSRARSIRRRRQTTRAGGITFLFLLVIGGGYLVQSVLPGGESNISADVAAVEGPALFDGDPILVEFDPTREPPEEYPTRTEPLPPVDCTDAHCDRGFVFGCRDGSWNICISDGDKTTIQLSDSPNNASGARQSPDGRHILVPYFVDDVSRVYDQQENLILEIDAVSSVDWFSSDRLLVPREDEQRFEIVSLDGEVESSHAYPPGLPTESNRLGPYDLAISADRSELVATFVPQAGKDQFEEGFDIWRYQFSSNTWTRYELDDWFITLVGSSSLGYGPDQKTILTSGISPLTDREDPNPTDPWVYDVLAVALDSGEVRTLASVSTRLDFAAVPSPDGTLIALRSIRSIQILNTITGELSNPVPVTTSFFPGLSWAPSNDRLAADLVSTEQTIGVLHIDQDMTLSDPYILPTPGFDLVASPHWSGTES